ncbi:HNH endonuclease signature motif containing protein [Pseudomonas sp. P8_241]|uniref:HNH endonuclease n=1 Tax=Pseudomonas sp. P8_241 TaxID=3043445 RepID=UPI002A362776|nr:HNH endonuclease signature motif containing protein [Pseudomonas sp. P8_241]WPN49114.1 HNH endonuclease signature motif containing protein [Pseudomonas sp. P8_241]
MDRHLYNKDELFEFGPFNGSAIYSARQTILIPGDRIQVVSGSATKPKRYFYHGSYKYVQEIESDKAGRRKYTVTPIQPLIPPIEITREILPAGDTFNTFIGSRTTSLGNVPHAYSELYLHLIDASGQYKEELECDVEKIANSADFHSKTSIVREMLCRLGQGQFKKNVMRVWGYKSCALTGIDLPEMLIASHIKPWAKCTDGEHLNGCNGIILASHIDKLFDSHLITFRERSGQFILDASPKIKTLISMNFKITHNSLHLGMISPSNYREASDFMKLHNIEFERKSLRP